MTTTYLRIALILCFVQPIYSGAQNQQLLSGGGQMDISSGMYVSWSLGEPFVNTHQLNNMLITEGFQQFFTRVSNQNDPDISSIDLYPNPASDKLYVKWPDVFSDGSRYIIYNAQGQLIRVKRTTGNPSLIDIDDLSGGIYILYLWDLKSTLIGSRKFIKR